MLIFVRLRISSSIALVTVRHPFDASASCRTKSFIHIRGSKDLASDGSTSEITAVPHVPAPHLHDARMNITAAKPTVEERCDMNRDEVEGKVEQAKGKLKQAAGRVTDDPDLQDEGAADEAAGAAQETFGKGKRKVGEAIEDIGKAVKK